jgi:predicted ferric reductase
VTRIRLSFWGFLIALSLLWLIADPLVSTPYQYGAMRDSLINYTGIITIGVMSVAMMLSLRPVFLETALGGLDKTYRLHKWLGLGALAMAIAHFLWISAPGWLISIGVMSRPARQGGRPITHDFALLRSLSGPAQGVGAWAFWATVALVILALIRRFPYRYFLQTHRLLSIVYLFLVFHSVVLMKFIYWSKPLAYVMVALMAGGIASAFITLFRKVGRTRQVVGEIAGVTHHADVQILEVSINTRDRWSGHKAGQFAFVKFDDGEGPHPFTISSQWNDDGCLRFLIKHLGDYTSSLPAALKVGDLATVEGPYGRFNFSGRKPRQIWISGGIGITPFISRMEELAREPDGKAIDLFHATSVQDAAPIDKLRGLAEKANVQMHVWVTAQDGRLTAERIRQDVSDWKSADVWFCGPIEFGKDLRRDFRAAGLGANAFHEELFHLR